MSDYQIRIKPVYSQTVPTPEGLLLPAGWNLAWHQLATLLAGYVERMRRNSLTR